MDGLETEFPEQYKKFKFQFDSQCLDQESCNIFIKDDDWPKVCSDKIGNRFRIVSANTKPKGVYIDTQDQILDGTGSGGNTMTFEQEVDTDGDGEADGTQEREFTFGFDEAGRRALEASTIDEYRDAYNYVS